MRPLAVTRLKVDDYHRLRVFIWPDMDTMQKVLNLDCRAYWQAPAIIANVLNNEIMTKLVGSLHFYNGGFGAGTFAHELQHFIQDWIDIGSVDTSDQENVPKLAGDLTNEFWVWFYDHFKIEAGPNL